MTSIKELLEELPIHQRRPIEREYVARYLDVPQESVRPRTLRFAPGSKRKVWLILGDQKRTMERLS